MVLLLEVKDNADGREAKYRHVGGFGPGSPSFLQNLSKLLSILYLYLMGLPTAFHWQNPIQDVDLLDRIVVCGQASAPKTGSGR